MGLTQIREKGNRVVRHKSSSLQNPAILPSLTFLWKRMNRLPSCESREKANFFLWIQLSSDLIDITTTYLVSTIWPVPGQECVQQTSEAPLGPRSHQRCGVENVSV